MTLMRSAMIRTFEPRLSDFDETGLEIGSTRGTLGLGGGLLKCLYFQ